MILLGILIICGNIIDNKFHETGIDSLSNCSYIDLCILHSIFVLIVTISKVEKNVKHKKRGKEREKKEKKRYEKKRKKEKKKIERIKNHMLI